MRGILLAGGTAKRLRPLTNVTNKHLNEVRSFLTEYLKYVNYKLDKDKTIKYLTQLKNDYSIAYFLKQFFQIRKFLRYYNIEWVENIKPPQYPIYEPKRVSKQDIRTN